MNESEVSYYNDHQIAVMEHFQNFDNFDEMENSFYDEPDNLFGLGKKAKRKRALKKGRAELEYNRQQADIQIQQRAIDQSLQPSTVALQNVQENLPVVQSYVQNAGHVPQQNPAALSLQASNIFADQVAQRQMQGVPDYSTAMNSVIEDQQDSWGEEADEFFGSIISSVFQAGKALVNKINQKREANGKKPLFRGKNWQKLAEKINNNETVITDALSANEKAIIAITQKEIANAKALEGNAKPLIAAKDAFIADQTKQAFMTYLPYILIVLVIVFVAGKKSS